MRRFAGGLVAVVLLAGCGGEPPVSSAASEILTADVARLKAAATSGTSAEVARAADLLRTDVSAQQASGALSEGRATAILDQLARVLADTAARPLPAPTPSPEPKATERGDDDEKGKGRGKGEGRD